VIYLRPATLQQAFSALATRRLSVLAGGTDHFPARVASRSDEDILDVTAIGSLRGIRETETGWRIGATTTWTAIIEARLPPLFDALKLAAREIGGVQIQNAGTVAGNLCNASPAADGVPPLLALDALVELSSGQGVRIVPLAEFIIGPRRTARLDGELLTAILVPKPKHEAHSRFVKLGARKYLLISIAMVAATVEVKAGLVRKARVAVGSCSPVARTLALLENELIGKRFDRSLGEHARAEHLGPLTPIDDVRASAEYRTDAALTLVRRTLQELASA
jgi:CO/xanthine dehydrogenase FAD-binding subunit